MSIEAMKQALEALELALCSHGVMLLSDPPQDAWKTYNVEPKSRDAITALRTAIEQAEKQEPVAWMNKHGACKTSLFREVEAGAKDEYTIPLYTAPPAAQQEPVSPAQKDAVFAASIEFIETLTGMTPPPIEIAPPEVFKTFRDFTEKVCSIFATPPAAQRQWVGLTDAEIEEWDYDVRDVVMDIEKLLREKNT